MYVPRGTIGGEHLKYPYFRMSKAEYTDQDMGHFLDLFEKTGISAVKLRHQAQVEEKTVYVYSIWRMGDEAHGTKRNMENIKSVTKDNVWYENPKVVERVNDFPEIERLLS